MGLRTTVHALQIMFHETKTVVAFHQSKNHDDAQPHPFMKQGEDKSLNVFVRSCSTFDARRLVSLGITPA